MHKKWLVIGLVFHLLWTNAQGQTEAPVRFLNDSLFVAPQADGPLLGLFDLSGRQRMPFAFTEIEAVGYSGRLKARKKGAQFGLFDTEGRELTFLELADFEAPVRSRKRRKSLLPPYLAGHWRRVRCGGCRSRQKDAALVAGVAKRPAGAGEVYVAGSVQTLRNH